VGIDPQSRNHILDSVKDFNVVFWFPNIPNDLPKIRGVKEINPYCMLITSKRNFYEEYEPTKFRRKYCFEELVSRAHEQKANLCFEFTDTLYTKDLIMTRVFDPLGAVWCDTTAYPRIIMARTYKRLTELMKFTRQSTLQAIGAPPRVPEGFIDIIHGCADIFHELVCPPETVQRFLGNASFRCTEGFPSFRYSDDIIAVSRRNVSKTGITNSDFIMTQLDKEGNLYAFGENKPSVDTPIQVRLYDELPCINFMMHSHVYVEGAPFTDEAIPCGALEEVNSIMRAIKKHDIDPSRSFCLNLLGHGNTVFATDLEYFKTVKYIARPIPEIM
jgi:hypothetical protein